MTGKFLPIATLLALLTLAGCDSAEEQAEEHYQTALTLLEGGDVDRALVELRNVFDDNGFHKDARQLYADLLIERGETAEAYSQYLRLIEQYPDTLEVRLTLSRLAAETGNWDEVQRHGEAAIALAPDDPEVRAIAAALAYRRGALDNDDEAKSTAAAEARAVLETLPGNGIARRIVIDSLASDPLTAVAEIDQALEHEPDTLNLHVLKFQMLSNADETDRAQTQLEEMYARFPDRPEVRDTLIQWYASRGNMIEVESLLRNLAGPRDGDPAGHITVVEFLQQTQGAQAAATELDRLIDATDGQEQADVYRSLRAVLDFEAGDADGAITTLETIVAAAEPSDQRRQIQGMLAQMLAVTGNAVGARALIEEVLAEDPSNVAALKLRAAALIEGDDPDAAIIDLRNALNQEPRDFETMTLMAQAHERNGNQELAGERLALAVEVSNAAPEPSLRYARFLVDQGRIPAARTILNDTRRNTPGSLPVLQLSAELALREQDWPEVEVIIALLEQAEVEAAAEMANELRSALLLAQGRNAEMASLLESQIASGDDITRATALLVLSHLREEDPEAARAAMADAVAENPADPSLRLLDANLSLSLAELDRAETILRGLVDEFPGAEAPAGRLYQLLQGMERYDEASALLAAELETNPSSRLFRTLQAVELEEAGDIDGAIDLYETLYGEDTSNVLIANNLASLLATHRNSDEDLTRAEAVARRLRGREIPQFQDTYGWIAYRRGNLDEALSNLEAAAAGLPESPLVQFHLGMTYAALNQTEEARAFLERALELAGESPLPQYRIARETLEALPVSD